MTYQLNPNSLTDKLEALGFDFDKFCDYATKTLKTLCDAGGDDTQASLKLYEVLMSSNVDSFDSDFRTYKAAASAKDKALNFTKLIIIKCAEHMSLVMHSQWPSSPKAPSKKQSIDNTVALKAELKRK
eukprot:275004-Ditylum_brightwellii.AAC.1